MKILHSFKVIQRKFTKEESKNKINKSRKESPWDLNPSLFLTIEKIIDIIVVSWIILLKFSGTCNNNKLDVQ